MPERDWKGQVPTWFGIPCRLGRVTIWLPALEGHVPLRALLLVALFPRSGARDSRAFVQPGTHFVLEHRAKLHLDCSSAAGEGRLIIPQRKACVCDGSQALWALFSLHLLASGFIPILDFVHLVTYLYAAAGAAQGKGTPAAWRLYERWLRLAWSGDVAPLLAALRDAARRAGEPPEGAAEDDPRQVLADAVTYVTNNRPRMGYPRYRRLGLPICSAPVESTIKQVNRRIKGSEKFWLPGGAEAVLQVRAAYLSQDDRARRLRDQPRPYARSVGAKRLRPAA